MKSIICGRSSWFMCDNDSKEFRGYFILITEATKKSDESQHYFAMNITIIEENSNCS